MSQDAELFLLEQGIGRGRWQFTFPAAQVQAAAAARAVEHRERERYYAAERERFAANLVAETGVVDKPPTSIPMASPLQPFDVKMREHLTQAETYERWARALKSAGNQELKLTFEDVSFFGL
jgi:hypothetical protein